MSKKINAKPPTAVYEFNGIRYEVSREFSEAVPLRELLRRVIAETSTRNPPVDQAANL